MGLALLPASFAYAILRHNVVDISLLQRWLVHGLLWVGLLVAYAVVVAAADLLLAPLPDLDRRLAVAALLVLLVGLSFGRLHDRLRRGLDHLIFRDSYDYRASLQQLSRDLSLAGDLDALGASLSERLRSLMNLEFAVLLVHRQEGSAVHGVAGNSRRELLPGLAVAASAVRQAPLVVSLGDTSVDVLLVPLRLRDEVVGHMCLGPKSNGEPFASEDRDLLATLSGHVAAIVQNAQLVDDLRWQVREQDLLNERLQRAQEDERARLAADLHDEPLQTALLLQRLLAGAAVQGCATSDHVALSQTLAEQLRGICTTMRPPALNDLGLTAALDVLAQVQAEPSDVSILIDVDAELDGLSLSPTVEIVLYRAAQEALTNALRHAHPSSIRIALREQSGAIRLLVADDGRGFDPPRRLEALATQGHLGLAGLDRRVQQAGGVLKVASTPGEGTIVRVDMPLDVVPQ